MSTNLNSKLSKKKSKLSIKKLQFAKALKTDRIDVLWKYNVFSKLFFYKCNTSVIIISKMNGEKTNDTMNKSLIMKVTSRHEQSINNWKNFNLKILINLNNRS